MKQNYRLTISYDGTRYHGWEAKQNTEMTIQGKLEQVLARMAGGPVKVIGAGRTDAGVHALAMTANVHLDLNRDVPQNTLPASGQKLQPDPRRNIRPDEICPDTESGIRNYLNHYLPEDICVQEVKAVSERFHSRYNASGKTYCYTCYDGPAKPVFDRKYVCVLDRAPDLARMREAAGYLTGTHDFASFCGNPKMKKSTVRTIESISIEQHGGYLKFTYRGDGFLYHMVRILTGTLLEVGFGKRRPESMPDLLAARQRSQAGFLAPAQGLCLMEVRY